MNREWAEQNKKMQKLLKKSTFSDGISELLSLREKLYNEMRNWHDSLSRDDYNKMPFINAKGYHSKTVAYSIWHIIRIEDIVTNSLIRQSKEVLFDDDFGRRINTPIITTGNELIESQIADFSEKLDIDVLYEYAEKVYMVTNEWLRSVKSMELSRCFDETDKEGLKALNVVSEDENAVWLIDYWCNKDVSGLIKMPLSRHWIMHIEAANRIIDEIKR